MTSPFSLNLTFILYASPQKVFEALTTETIIKKWSNSDAQFKLEDGFQYQMFDGRALGEIISFKPNDFLSYTWKSKNWAAQISPSIVNITFAKNIAGTKILIEHKNLPNLTELNNHKEGWVTYVLEPLNDFFIDQM